MQQMMPGSPTPNTVRAWSAIHRPRALPWRQLHGLVSNHKEESPAAAGLSMGRTGLEPVTSCLSSRRSPS